MEKKELQTKQACREKKTSPVSGIITWNSMIDPAAKGMLKLDLDLSRFVSRSGKRSLSRIEMSHSLGRCVPG